MEKKPVPPGPVRATLPPAAGPSIRREMQNVAQHGGATIEELRDFVHGLQGRSPQEMMGIVSQSGLFKATAQATVATVVILVLFTLGPYAWSKIVGPGVVAAPAAAPSASPAANQSDPAEATTAAPKGDNASAAPNAQGGADELLNRLGEGESKNAPLDENPLESGTDDLLKDLK